MTSRIASTTARRVTALLFVALLALGAAACGGADAPAASPTQTPSEATDVPTEPATPAATESDQPADEASPEPEGTTDDATEVVADGSFAAYLGSVEDATVTVDEIEILSGEEAVAARAEDGEAPAEEGVDIPYLRNRDDRLRTIPVASDVVVAVYDCSQACEHVEWSYSDLVAGTPLPYGTMDTPFIVTVEGGEVVELSEVYLP